MKEAIWAAIHKIERAASKDDLGNMSRADAIEDWGMENDVDVSEIDVEEVFWEG